MSEKIKELKAIVESLHEWTVKYDEQSYLSVAIIDDWINVFNDTKLPAEKQFDMSRRNGKWKDNKTPAEGTAGESKNTK